MKIKEFFKNLIKTANKKPLHFILCAIFIASCFSSCSNSQENNTNSPSYSQPENSSYSQPENSSTSITPNNIFLSSNNISLYTGDTYQLYATILPSQAEQTVSFISVNPSCASVDSNGLITAKSEGSTTILAETINGLTATCNVNVKAATGTVKGTVRYQNGIKGALQADVGTAVQLISLELKTLPEDYWLHFKNNSLEAYGIYATEVDSSGEYIFENIPVGTYQLVIASQNAKLPLSLQYEYLNNLEPEIDRVYGSLSPLIKNMDDRAISIDSHISYKCTTGKTITVTANSTITNRNEYINSD